MLVCAAASPSQSPAQDTKLTSKAIQSKPAAQRAYDFMKTRVQGGDLAIDWSEFRIAAALAGLDGGFDWHPVRERVLAAVDAGNLPSALSGAQTVIDHNMAEPEGHLLAMMVYQKMGKDDAAQREREVLDALVKSIMNSGDGLSRQNAWVTVSRGEVEFVVSIVLDADTKAHNIVRTDGHDYDKLLVATDDGGEHTIWFNVDTDTQITSAALAAQSNVQPTLSASAKH
jgi:hypothetical protein